ncbi:DUF1016 N-terminal domain-containing protein [Mucilaginibacter flavus]|uniref:DUF1016 N-terminal domain-containing protein n=1 Tax=Mucilaginibacter flavus TaxID=931504 RepID=UPI0025B5175B|nr:DUF1016 N-terminal domain-containing protein [Mucilaginibacter flavus]MDN3579668.1 DUF1016 N-terminal domain-containing protein [Mucilaginibacter flavus]
MEIKDYQSLLTDVKSKIRKAQVKAALSVNAEMIRLYWEVGKAIKKIQNEKGWGSTVVARLANDIKNELPDVKGFSERNLLFMVQFYKEYSTQNSIVKQAVSQLETVNHSGSEFVKHLVSQIPWGHNILLMQKIKDIKVRLWYINQTISNGWSRDVLSLMIKSNLHLRQGEAINNFSNTLPPTQSDLVKETLKDPYIFDFITIAQSFTNVNWKQN